jgi:hypothetical protein
MRTQDDRSMTLKFMVTMSLITWSTIALILIYPPASTPNFYLQKQLVGIAFTALCASGAIAAVSPNNCVLTSEAHPNQTTWKSNEGKSPQRHTKGHHPDCREFSAHTLRFNDRTYCAACSGLFAGALVALLVAVPYFFLGSKFDDVSVLAVTSGQTGVMMGLIQFKLKHWFRSLANALFVVGGCLVLIGTDQYAHNFSIDIYLFAVLLLWISTRVVISEWDHSRICKRCGLCFEIEGRAVSLASSAHSVEGSSDYQNAH